MQTVHESIYLKGSNIWFLVCSTILACIGLDVNSPAVIIGAMLVSPLMNPILGIGISFGVNDKTNFFISIREFTFAIIISLITSTLYFLITPLGLATPEMLARIKPTILDVGVALFGGVAGIIANSRASKTAAIPGVAIATALMPPLCVAGFGIAKGPPSIFWGAFYLFFINSVFISAASYGVIRFLKFPYAVPPHNKAETRKKIYLLLFLVIIIVPSIFIFYNIIAEANQKNSINTFINNVINKGNYQTINWRYIQNKDTLNELRLYVVGNKVTDEQADSLGKFLPNYNIQNTSLKIISLDPSSGIPDGLKNEIQSSVLENIPGQQLIAEKNAEIDKLQFKLDKIKSDSIEFNNISNELKILFPELGKIGFSNILQQDSMRTDSVIVNKIPTYLIRWDGRLSTQAKRTNEQKIYEFIKNRMKLDTLQVLNY